MGLFKRLGSLVSANVNDLVERYEDPEKLLRQAVREMEAAVSEAMQAAAGVIANERLLKRQVDAHRRDAECWRARAAAAVEAGDDDTARAALARKADQDKLAAALADQRDAAARAARRLRRQLDALRVRLAEAERTLASLSARRRTAAARRTLVRDAHTVPIDESAFSRFDQLARRVEQEEAEAEALAELAGDTAACHEQDARDAGIEAELALLKAARGGGGSAD